jgi:hypothetical protein
MDTLPLELILPILDYVRCEPSKESDSNARIATLSVIISL